MVKILAFTDPHGMLAAAQSILDLAHREKPDLVLCSGDFSYFGSRYDGFLTRLRDLGQVVYFVPGNHETDQTLDLARLWFPFMKDVTFLTLEVAGLRIAGLPASLEFWPNGKVDEDIVENTVALLSQGDGRKPLVLLSHYPPWKTAISGLTVINPDSGGSQMVSMISERLNPTLIISGHYHQDFSKSDQIGSIRLVNPGPNGMIILA